LNRPDRPVSLEQIGHVSRQDQDDLHRLVRAHELSRNVTFRDRLSHRQTLERSAAADVLVLIQPGAPTQVPGKLYEMLMFRKPIVALTDDGETRDIMKRYDLGGVARPDDPAAIASALETAFQTDPDNPGRKAALAAFDGRRLARQLGGILDDAGRDG
jgi:glycosyltransferase involved in cell wall biosynthesis